MAEYGAGAKRFGPILISSEGLVEATGDRFALCGYDHVLRHLVRALLWLHGDFLKDRFHESLQLLRAVGAPVLGKTTFVMLSGFLQREQLQNTSMWQQWQMRDVQGLQRRLEA
jgi:hypothetical protein